MGSNHTPKSSPKRPTSQPIPVVEIEPSQWMVCRTCRKYKRLGDFRPYRRSCRECEKVKRKEHRRTKPMLEVLNNLRKKSPGEVIEVTPQQLEQLFQSQKGRCFYCGKVLKLVQDGNTSIDHKVPRVAGGTHTIDNLVFCCVSCNSRKQDMDFQEFIDRFGCTVFEDVVVPF